MGVFQLRATVRNFAAKVVTSARAELFSGWQRRPLRETAVLYESFSGNGMLCNPEAIFRALLDDPEFAELNHVWVLRDRRENAATITEFRWHPRVRFVRQGSLAYFHALATSGYLINNATFPALFGRRDGQTYLNTWHGTPLKKMGYDIGDPASRVANVLRNFLAADFLLSANTFMTERLYESAHRLGGIYAGTVIEEGYPRIDHQFADVATIASHRATLEEAGIAIGDREVILYAPTWKGTSFTKPDDDIIELAARLDELDRLIDTTRYVVLLKTHQVVHHLAHTVPGLAARLIPNTMPTNSLLAFTQVLVTDYSSIFFDFLATGRPMIFLTPDIAQYSDYRGFYLESAEWPGAVVSSIAEVAAEINRLSVSDCVPANPNYERMQATISPHEEGNATTRVIDVVFRGRTKNRVLRTLTGPKGRRILVSGGNLRQGSQATALLERLDEFDHDRDDVTVVFANSYRRDAISIQKRINPRVRQIARVGSMNGLWLSRRRRTLARAVGLRESVFSGSDQALWDAEWLRCFGLSTFDEIHDFGENSPFLGMLLKNAPQSR